MHTHEAGETLLLHQFDDLRQQKESSTLGMWLFLGTELMLFSGLFTAYSIYRALYPADFAAGSRHLNVLLGGINTAVLLCSSLTMALAVHAAQTRHARNVVLFLLATIVLGTGFLGIKAYEWYDEARQGLVPGAHFDWQKAERGHEKSATTRTADDRVDKKTGLPANANDDTGTDAYREAPEGRVQLFFVLYFFMTGLHGIHMIIGIGLVGVVAFLSWRRWFSGGGETQIEMTGLYWHFIDVIWVFLYPLLYLIDVR